MNYQVMKRHGENVNAYLSESSQSEKATYYMIPTIWQSGKDKTIAVKRLVATRDSGEEGMNKMEDGISMVVKLFFLIL